ncbi:type VI secretion system tube protein TssD [Saccharicrinis sp. GN24d3]|uniref:type VI secretion system tube protein TssD n=1 Tax=Saccharicrinis sp. GN24d3 TaxID=3458416 RepID=UPI00403660F7
MSCAARLHVKGVSSEKNGLKILSYNLSLTQEVDEANRVSGRVQIGMIHVSVQNPNDPAFVQWMVMNGIKEGEISLSGVIATGPHRSIQFKDARLVGYSESFADMTDIVVDLTIAAGEITLQDVNYAPIKS